MVVYDVTYLFYILFCNSVKQVFKEMEFLGWYTTGGPPDQSDIHIHKQVSGMYAATIFLDAYRSINLMHVYVGIICINMGSIHVFFVSLRCVRLLKVRSSSNSTQ